MSIPRGTRGRERARGRMRRRRAPRLRILSLVLVHVAITVHVVHWRLAGRTLAPLELNEALYTLELGIVTAGFVLFASALLATAVFGRFFCGWACHLLALQDLAAWLLAKVSLHPKPVRSRALALVPIAVMAYMFVWPHVARALVAAAPALDALVGARPAFELRLASDADGWGSFTTERFWRNLPSPLVGAVTLLFCGGALVWLLGSRSFCRTVCPYGALFALAARRAPGRIRLLGDCDGCGLCTAVCDSGVRVHEEVSELGHVASTACLRDLDCVSVCPTGGLAYAFRGGAPIALDRAPRRATRDFGRGEEWTMALVVLGTIPVARGLYFSVPFFLAVAIAVALGFGAVLAVRAWRGSTLAPAARAIDERGRARARTRALVAGGAAAVLWCHSALVRWSEWRGSRALARSEALAAADPSRAARELDLAIEHLDRCARIGLVRTATLQSRRGEAYRARGVARGLGGDLRAAVADLSRAVELAPDHGHARGALVEALAASGSTTSALWHARERARRDARDAGARYDLGVLLAATGDLDAAERAYEDALRLDPSHAASHNNLGFVLLRRGALADAQAHLERAIALDPGYAEPHLNLARVAMARGAPALAREHLARAAELDPRLAAPTGGR